MDERTEYYITELEHRAFYLEDKVEVLKRWCLVNSVLLIVAVGLMIFD